MTSSSIDKRALRKLVRARRDALGDAERAAAASAIAARAAAWIGERVAAGSVVALYAAKGSEVDTRELDILLRARGYAIAYPRVGEPGAPRWDGDTDRRELAFHLVDRREALALSSGLAIPEPAVTDPVVAHEAIAAFVIPGLVFDRTGGRLGWGRGHYDRALAAAPNALRIGLAFETQVVDETPLPREAHDMPIHAVITERG